MAGLTVDTTAVTVDSTLATVDGAGGSAVTLAGTPADTTAASGALINFATVTLVAPLFTGVGGIFDPNLVWPFSAPVAGSVVSYDPTFITVLPDGEINSTSNANITAEIQFNDGAHVNVVMVFITGGFVAYASDTSSAAGALVGSVIALAGAGSSLTSALASLTTHEPLAGSASDLTSAAGALTVSEALAGIASDITSAAAALTSGVTLAGVASDATSAAASLSSGAQLLGAASDLTTATAALSLALQGAASDGTSAAGALTVSQALAGAASDLTNALGALIVMTPLLGNAQDTTSAAAQLRINLMGAANDVVTSAASLIATLQGQATDTTSVTATFTAGVFPRGELIPLGPDDRRIDPLKGDMQADFHMTLPQVSKRAAAVKAFTIPLESRLRVFWVAGQSHNAGETVRPTIANGFAFQASAAGQSGSSEPFNGPCTLGQTFVDGSITWTAILPGGNALDPIALVAWSALNNDGKLTIPTQANTTEEATADFAGGTQGQIYSIQALVTTSTGLIYDVQFNLQIE